MVRLNMLYIIVLLILYRVKNVSSLTLDLSDIDTSKFDVSSVVENGVTKTTILTKRHIPIDELYFEGEMIWKGRPGEYVNSITHYSFENHHKMLLYIEVDNSAFENILYFYTRRGIYLDITEEEFWKLYMEITKDQQVFSPDTSEPTISTDINYEHTEVEKLEPDTESQYTPQKKTIKSEFNEDLNPEIIKAEVGSDGDDDETDLQQLENNIKFEEFEFDFERTECSLIDYILSSQVDEEIEAVVIKNEESSESSDEY